MCGDALPLAMPFAGGSSGWGGPYELGCDVGEGRDWELLVKFASEGPLREGVERGEGCC